MVNIQRLLDEGLFTASYKFALLLALAVLSMEQGDDSGAPLDLTTDAIAEKFVQYYWRQVVPYDTPGEASSAEHWSAGGHRESGTHHHVAGGFGDGQAGGRTNLPTSDNHRQVAVCLSHANPRVMPI